MSSAKVGGEVDAYCTKCKLSLAHTILAMVGTRIARVKCNTCNGDHAFKTMAAVTRARANRPSKAERVIISFTERLKERDTANAATYSPRDTYKADQIINHPTFGLGIVSAVRLDKVEVTFKADVKTLIHGRGGGPAQPKPAFQPASTFRNGPADKPNAQPPGEPEPSQESSAPDDAG
jgi:hypothetical protein